MDHNLAGSIIMLAELTIKLGQRDAFLSYTVENLPISRSANGNLAFEIWLDEAQPERVLFYEVWESSAAQQAYMEWRIERGDLTTLMAYLAAEPRFTALRAIAA